MQQDDYYHTLGVTPEAGAGQIKTAYRKLAFQHHPDRNQGNLASADAMKRVNEAYAVLSDPGKRREYDGLRRQFGSSAYSRFRTAHSEQDIFSGSDINSVLEEMARAFGFRGFEDIFKDFYGQAYQEFEFKRPGGSVRTIIFGRTLARSSDREAVGQAAGPLGRIARFAFRKLSGIELPVNGAAIYDRIHLDRGLAASGGPYAYFLRERSKKLVVQIPSGVREGQRIRLAGMGGKGKAGGRDGDLFLEVRLRRPLLKELKNFFSRVLKNSA
jgi:DnaJ-class molecular chaperone